MAAISLSDCTLYKNKCGSYGSILIVTPSTADSADTIDVSELVTDGQLLRTDAWDVTYGDSVTCTYATATGVLTVDASGGTSDHIYAVEIKFVGYTFTP